MAPRHSLTDTYRSMAHLRRFFESVRRTITTEPTNGGLTPAQQFALLTLAGNPSNDPLTIGDLARETFATMNTTSALVRRMERAGLVRTTRSPKDHRFVYVKLTASGERRRSEERRVGSDWSSDVCSSDLHDLRPRPADGARRPRPHDALPERSPLRLREADRVRRTPPSPIHGRRREGPPRGRRRTGKSAVARRVRNVVRQLGRRHRSEERRVGKECRSRWSP